MRHYRFVALRCAVALATPPRRARLEAGRPGARQTGRRAGRRRLPRRLPAHRLRSRSTASRLRPASRSAAGWPSSRWATQAMVMGDLVLTQDEVDPVMRKLVEGGIEITALHNHLLRAEPATLYMHVDGHGDPVKLAHAIHDGLALSKTPFAPPPRQRRTPAGHRHGSASTACSAARASDTAASTSSASRAPSPSRSGGMALPAADGRRRSASTSSRPATARRRSPATSC